MEEPVYNVTVEVLNDEWVCCTVMRGKHAVGEFFEFRSRTTSRRVPCWGVIPDGI